MTGAVRRALGLEMEEFAERSQRVGSAARRSWSSWASLVARLVIAGAFVTAQPVFADTTLQTAVQPKADGYSALVDYLKQREQTGTTASIESPHAASADYSTLANFVKVADSSGSVPNDQLHAGLNASQTGDAPNDIVHAGFPKSDSYAVLAGFVDDADAGKTVAKTDAPAASDDYSVLKAFNAQADDVKPIVVAAAKVTKKEKPVVDLAASPATYIGSQACVACHRNQVGNLNRTVHGDILLKRPRSDEEKQGCEACHGPGSIHAKTKDADQGRPGDIIAFGKGAPRPVEERNAICLSCHENGDRTYWKGSAHEGRDLACTNCHQIMEKVSPKHQMIRETEVETCFQCHKDRRAQFERPSHHPLKEGDMTCSSCHNPHGSATDKLLKEASINETCYKCHADKRGPLLWEHEPVRENCLNCHEPHGTVNEYMLKVQRPRLCQQCHMGVGHGNPGDPTAIYQINRSCQNCHTKVHGSNAPAGSLFQR